MAFSFEGWIGKSNLVICYTEETLSVRKQPKSLQFIQNASARVRRRIRTENFVLFQLLLISSPINPEQNIKESFLHIKPPIIKLSFTSATILSYMLPAEHFALISLSPGQGNELRSHSDCLQESGAEKDLMCSFSPFQCLVIRCTQITFRWSKKTPPCIHILTIDGVHT